MGKWLLRLLAAVLGTGLAAGLFCSFALVRVEGSDMLPTLEPGDYVLVSKWKKDNLAVGDLVLYEAPYYEIDGARYPRGAWWASGMAGSRSAVTRIWCGTVCS